MEFSIQNVNLHNPVHRNHFIKLLNDYIKDPMGNNRPMRKELAPKIISGLKKHARFLGFFVLADDQFAGLANCNINFSTFQAKPIINIHDFVVAPEFRNLGAGEYLLDAILKYASSNGFCRVNLEVREDNLAAKSLYKKMGFSDCVPKMLFWEKKV
ncbi:MAG TPA: GNAT family N-acetyltransferase [Draconibacterium sp.]|nr:GNAT family N-acetyltransferase [Draconibacterium sp.]